MRIKNILLTGIAALVLTSCNNYLNVDAPSAYSEEFVYSQKSEIERALNGVYAHALVGDLYGNAYQLTFIYNSDVDIQISSDGSHEHNSYSRYDCDDEGSDILKFWTAAYSLVEYCNKFISSAENSKFYLNIDNDPEWSQDGQVLQWIGEAKCLRAMIYHDLVVMFGDVPFTFTPASKRDEYVIPVTDRQVIQDALIADLKEASRSMSPASSVTVEHCSKEFAQAMIARIALTAGGYSLRPDKSDVRNYGTMQRPDNYRDYYQTARAYADSVISSGSHDLRAEYQNVFVNECNYQIVNNDDPIFEIPFAKESTGNTGYIQGPTYSSYEGKTVGPWGACSGNGRLNAFYRFLFRDNDLRREFINGLWYYSYFTDATGALADTVYIRQDYTVHNNKWSKFWSNTNTDPTSEGSTGINFPYMRYADVLLMFAEAENEIYNGPTAAAKSALKSVRERAFRNASNKALMVDAYVESAGSKEEFFDLIFTERAWEFAGEGTRWKDLVRWNRYAEVVFKTFWTYYGKATDDYTYDLDDKFDTYPTDVFYKIVNPGDALYPTDYNYPNKTLPVLKFYKYESDTLVIDNMWENFGLNGKYMPPTTGEDAWTQASWFSWQDDTGARPQIRCSLRGYIYIDVEGNKIPATMPELSADMDFSILPPVRYILPIPQDAVTRSNGAYKNYYGY